MKKFLWVFFMLLAMPAWAVEFEGIYDQYQVVYSPSANVFSTGGMAEDRIVLSKKTSSGSGSYSEYYTGDKLAVALGSNFEFVKDGRLIACHNADLKFFEVLYEDGKFVEKELNAEEVQKVFPDAKIVKISDFVKRKFNFKKKPFEVAEILILNDTEASFYKYSFSPAEVKKTDVAGLIEVNSSGRIVFAHFGDNNKEFPKYTIITKLGFW